MNWPLRRLSHVATLKGRIGWQNLRKDEFTAAGPYLVTGMHFTDAGRVDWTNCFHVTEDRWRQAPEIQLARDDVLITKDGSIGKIAFIDELPGKASLNSHLLVVRPRGDSFVPRFLYYVLLSRLFLDFIEVEKKGTTFHGISQESVERFHLPLPPVSYQQETADALDAETTRIDSLIAKKRQMVSLLDERYAGAVEAAVRSMVSEDGEVSLKRLVDDVTVGIVVTPSEWYADEGVLALRGLNVRPGRIDATDVVHLSPEGHRLHRKSALRAGDVVVVRTGQAGAAAVVPVELDSSNCIDLLIVRPGDMDPEFLALVLNSDWAQKQIARNSVGSIQSHFNVSALRAMAVPNSSLVRQQRTVQQVRSLTAPLKELGRKLDRQIELLQEHRRALITAAVTGEMEVPGVAA